MENTFSDWLQKWLGDQGLSQNSLAEKAGISSGHMSKIMNGARISPEVAARLSPHVNLPADRILQMSGRLAARQGSSPRLDELFALFTRVERVRRE